MFWNNPHLSDADKDRLGQVRGFGPSKWGVRWPGFDGLEKAGDRLRDPDQMLRRNAFWMLRAIRRRRRSQPKRKKGDQLDRRAPVRRP